MGVHEEHLAVEKDQYEKINTLTSKVEQLTGAVDVANQINLELMKLLKKALCYMFWVIVFLIGAIIYGAIGKDGFYAVRGTIPMPSQSVVSQDAIPWTDKSKIQSSAGTGSGE